MNQSEVILILESNITSKMQYKYVDDMAFIGKRDANEFIFQPGNQNCFYVKSVVSQNENKGSIIEITFHYFVMYYILIVMTAMFLVLATASFVNGSLNIGSLAVGSMMIVFLFIAEIYKYHCISKIIQLTKSIRK